MELAEVRRRTGLTSKLAACVWIPLFALRAEEQRRPDLLSRPTALLSPEENRRIWEVSSLARHFGVRPGMTVSQAIGLCPTLVLREPDPVYYDEQFSRLLLTLSNVSPIVEPAALGRVFVGVDGLERLYGGAEEQLEAIKTAVGRYGGTAVSKGEAGSGKRETGNRTVRPSDIPPGEWRGGVGDRREGWGKGEGYRRGWSRGWEGRYGWGRGKFVAWAAAKRAKPGEGIVVSDAERTEFLRQQPVAVLPFDPDTHRRLWQLGVKTLGELAALPETAVISQFGRRGGTAWQLATGVISEPVVGSEAPEPIVTEVDFPAPVADRGMLINALEMLTERALRHPRRVGWRVHVVRVRAALEHGISWMIDATLKDPSADRDSIAAPLKTRLEQIPPPGAVEHLAVEFTAFVRGTTELQLFARDATSAARAGRQKALRWAACEIQTRLKRSMLHHVIEVTPWSRIPERRYALIDFDP